MRGYPAGYTIDKKNANHINAIITHNPTVSITKVNGRHVDGTQWHCSDLSKLLETRNEDFYIEIMSAGSESTFGVLPPLNRDKLQKLVEKSSTQDEKTAEYADLIKGYFVKKNANGGAEVFTCPPEIKGLTENGALYVLSKLTQVTDITGTMIFPQHNKILLQFKHDNYSNYIIDYSVNGRGFRKMDMLSLDIDDGFSYDLYAEPSDNDLVDELKILFQAWKNNDYQGRLIPVHLSGFVYDAITTNSNNNSASLSDFSFLAHAAASSNAPASANIVQEPKLI